MNDFSKPYDILANNDFDRLDELERMRQEEEKPPTFSEIELEFSKKEAFEKGREAGLREALTSQEERIAKYVETLTQQLAHIQSTQSAFEALQQKEVAAIAVSIADKITPSLIQKHGSTEIETLIRKTLQKNIKITELNVYIHPDLFKDVEERIAQILHEENLTSRINFKEDGNIGLGDCRVEWENGGIARTIPTLWQDITKTVESFLDGETVENLVKITDETPQTSSEALETSDTQPHNEEEK